MAKPPTDSGGPAAVERQQLPDGSTRWTHGRAEVVVSLPGPRTLLARYRGHMTAEIMRAVLDELSRHARSGERREYFSDSLQMTYEPAVRDMATDWAQKNKSNFAALHILQGSKLIAMGVAVANLALGGAIRAYTDRDEFERALAEASGTAPPSAGGRPNAGR